MSKDLLLLATTVNRYRGYNDALEGVPRPRGASPAYLEGYARGERARVKAPRVRGTLDA